MASPLDFILESHDGPEPRVLSADIKAVLEETIRPDDPDSGLSVAQVADRAGCSTRTIYRHLSPEKPDMALHLADQLCRACEVRMRDRVRLVWPDGLITDYTHVPVAV
jgi:AcrR family transcriptional regulator